MRRHVSKDQSGCCAECGQILLPSDYQRIYLNFSGEEPLSIQKFKEETAKLRSVLKQLVELEGKYDSQVRERFIENEKRESNEEYLNEIKSVLSQRRSRRYVKDNCLYALANFRRYFSRLQFLFIKIFQ